MNREEPSLIGKFYIWYRTEVFPSAKKYRGATRLLKSLEKIVTRNIGKVEEVEPIAELEWDNLILLDGCRHDVYEEVNGQTQSRISAGSMSAEYISENFSSGDWSDVVVITANPFYHKSRFNDLTGRDIDEVFHTVFHVWKTDWDAQENTVLPEKMIEKVKTADKLFPDKRKIIHFMQPHYPFIDADLDAGSYDHILEEDENTSAWWLAMKQIEDHEKIRDAYKGNLERVMPAVDELKKVLSGKTAVSADHGNLVGEKGLYGHPDNLNIKPLKKVPWDVNE